MAGFKGPKVTYGSGPTAGRAADRSAVPFGLRRQPMSTPKTDVQTAWEEFQADMRSLRDELRRHYEPASTEDADLQTSLNKLGKAADEVFEALGRATRDPDVRQGTRQAARSFE